jgi:hypothetical protein
MTANHVPFIAEREHDGLAVRGQFYGRHVQPVSATHPHRQPPALRDVDAYRLHKLCGPFLAVIPRHNVRPARLLRQRTVETGEQRLVSPEDLGLDYYPAFVAATDEYFYFYNPSSLYLGTAIFNLNGKEVERPIQKLNNGKLYRMNKDGTNIVCVYDNPNYELNRNVIIYDDKIVMQGRYMKVENKVQTIWGGAIQVATINPDGTIGEFVEVEVLQ